MKGCADINKMLIILINLYYTLGDNESEQLHLTSVKICVRIVSRRSGYQRSDSDRSHGGQEDD